MWARGKAERQEGGAGRTGEGQGHGKQSWADCLAGFRE